MPSRRKRLYGWSAPVNIGVYGALLIFLVGSFLALQVSLVILTLAWGPPPDPALFSIRYTRPVLLGLSLLALLLWPANRRILFAIPCFLVLSAAPLYSPHHVVLALAGLFRTPTLPRVLVMVVSLVLGAGLVSLVAIGLRNAFRLPSTSMRGSTEWGKAEALKRPREGLLLGVQDNQMLRYDGGGHLLTVAATRSGKGVGTIMPNLLNYPHSVVVTDPKGENYYVTARYRREKLGHEVVVLDPFELTKPINHEVWAFNPLDMIDLSGNSYVEMAMMMADMMIVRQGTGGDPHWNLEAKALLYTFILHAANHEDPSRRHLIEVRRLLTLGQGGDGRRAGSDDGKSG